MEEILCGCNGCPVKGAICGYVSVGVKNCKAPESYECYYKTVIQVNEAEAAIEVKKRINKLTPTLRVTR